MKPQSIRMPKELWAALEQDAEQRNRTTAEHIREICRQAIEQDVKDIYSRIDALEESVGQLEQRAEQIDELEHRVDRLESQMSGLTARTVESRGGEEQSIEQEMASESTSESASHEVPTSVEDIDDVIAKARADGATESQLTAGRKALELLRERRRVPTDELRDAVRSGADPDESPAVWWAEQVKPIVDIAMEWGLVVQHRGNELEWMGLPE